MIKFNVKESAQKRSFAKEFWDADLDTERSPHMYSSAYVWAKVLSYLEERMSPTTVSAWFDDAEVVELNENNLILYSPSDFRREVIRRRCTDYIQDALKEILDRKSVV